MRRGTRHFVPSRECRLWSYQNSVVKIKAVPDTVENSVRVEGVKVRGTNRHLGPIAKAVTQRAGKCRSHCQDHSCRWGLGSWLASTSTRWTRVSTTAGGRRISLVPLALQISHRLSIWQKGIAFGPWPQVRLGPSRLPAPPSQGREWNKCYRMFNPKQQYLARGGREGIFTHSLIQQLTSEWVKHPLHMGAVLVLRIQQ